VPTADHIIGPGSPSPAALSSSASTPATAAGQASRSWDRERIVTAAAVTAVVAVGVALRIWVVGSNLGPVDSDEAAGGLIARHFLEGEGAVFLWGNNYGGTLEAILTAPIFALFGSGVVTLKLVPIGAFAAACVLTWRIGLRTVGPGAARLGAGILWVASGPVVLISTKARLYYGAALVLTCAVVLLCLRLAEAPSRRDVAVLGLVLGLGLWTAPFVFYVAVPALLWLAVKRPRLIFDAPWGVPGAVLGSSPWLWFNLQTGWDALRELRGSPVPTSYLDRLENFYTELLPKLIGLRTYDGPWSVGRAGKVLFVLVLIAGVALVVWSLWHRRAAVVPLVVIAVGYPVVYAAPKSSWYTGEPRYGLFLAPVLALLLAWALTAVLRRRSVQLGVLGLVVLTTVAGLQGLMDFGKRNPGHHDLTPRRLGNLADALEREGVRTVVADYWIAYALSFETRERIIATPNPGQVRYGPYQRKVADAGARTYVYFQGQTWGEAIEAAARDADVGTRKLTVDGFDIYLFDQPVGRPPPPG
jgi:4-amino-4-deoxy-L-arabinose transferase-like glycosyltransferase